MTYPITQPADNAAAYTYTQPIRDAIGRVNELTDPADASSPKRLPVAALATGTPTGTKFLRDDRTWQVPSGGSSTENSHTISASGTVALDPSATGTYKIVTLTANCTFTFASGIAGQVVRMDVELIEDATGGRTVTWPTVLWQAGVVPTHVTNANSRSLYTFWNPNNLGWRGALVGQGYA